MQQSRNLRKKYSDACYADMAEFTEKFFGVRFLPCQSCDVIGGIMIFNIASKLNVNMLNEKICQFRHSAIGHERPYIFMSQETAKDVYIEVHESFFGEEMEMGGMIGTYSGNKLFIIPEMRYGEIELR